MGKSVYTSIERERGDSKRGKGTWQAGGGRVRKVDGLVTLREEVNGLSPEMKLFVWTQKLNMSSKFQRGVERREREEK